jgi:hypothetical protein
MQPETLKNIKSECLNLSNDFRILTKQTRKCGAAHAAPVVLYNMCS